MAQTKLNDIQMMILAAAALLPAVILLIYIYKKDRVEKEPAGLIFSLLLFGALVGMPVALVETFIDSTVLRNTIFYDAWYRNSMTGEIIWSKGAYIFYAFIENFFGVALIEEFGKRSVMRLLTHNNPNFNSLFDGVVYGVCAALGFAALENVTYVLANARSGGMSAGLDVALMRAFLSVPSHMFFGIIMGYHYSYAHAGERAAALERHYAKMGLITVTNTFSGKSNMRKSLWIPVAVHGLYDFLLSIDLFYPAIALVAVMYIVCFRRVRMMSDMDIEEDRLAYAMILQKYPELKYHTDTNTMSV